MSERETYLGDGLYAQVDPTDGMIILKAPRLGGVHWVGLDAIVLEAFLRFVGDVTGRGPLACRHGEPLTERCKLCNPDQEATG